MRKAAFTILLLAWAGYARGEDCNRNGIEDAIEIAEGRADDCNGNGIPDECDVRPGHIRFRLTERRPSDQELFDLRVADIDGDGDRDFVTSDGISGRLHIAFNRGDGTFELDTIAIEDPRALSLADFDGDGLIDIALTEDSFPGSVRFLWNVGEGRFGAVQKVPFDKDPFSLVPADFDLDGDLDLAVGSPASHRISLLENGGGREFEEVREYVARLPFELVAADLDTDGDLDLIGGGGGVPMTLLFNDGHGAFPKSRPYGPWSALEANDLDGDGDVDISGISPGPRGTLHLAWNDGTGDFSDLTSLSIPGAQEHIAGDIDRDGDTDILVTEGGPTLVVRSWINDGKGAFAVVSSGCRTSSARRSVDVTSIDLMACDNASMGAHNAFC